MTRNLKQRRERLLASGEAAANKVAQLELKATQDLACIRGVDIGAALLPRALAKLGLAPLPAGAGGTRPPRRRPGEAAVGAQETGGGGSSEEGDKPDAGSDGASDEADVANGAVGPVRDGATPVAAPVPLAPEVEALVARMLGHSALKAAIESMDDAVTQRRRERLAVAEGRPQPRKPKPGAPRAGEDHVMPTVNHRASRTIFLSSLSGEAEEIFFPDSDDDGDGGDGEVRPRDPCACNRGERWWVLGPCRSTTCAAPVTDDD